MPSTILLCAGGTGGHLFPAEAVASVLEERGWRVELATDHRAKEIGRGFPAAAIHIVPSATPSGRGVFGKAKAMLQLAGGLVRALFLLRSVRPVAAAGFGGYPTVPPILAARLFRVPTVIHEQNAVMGRANKLLARSATRIATSSPALKLQGNWASKSVPTGNPVRPAVNDAAGIPYQAPLSDGPIRLVVFGGSQGARYFSHVMPAALRRLRPDLVGRLRLVQQCRPEDLEEVSSLYRSLGIEAETASFFANLPSIIAKSHLVISRSGATTVSELAVIGRPAILVPLPGAIDQDQRVNAEYLANAGGAWAYDERSLGPRQLADRITDLFDNSDRLVAAANAAAAAGVPDGAQRLANLIELVARKSETTPSTSVEPNGREADA